MPVCTGVQWNAVRTHFAHREAEFIFARIKGAVSLRGSPFELQFDFIAERWYKIPVRWYSNPSGQRFCGRNRQTKKME